MTEEIREPAQWHERTVERSLKNARVRRIRQTGAYPHTLEDAIIQLTQVLCLLVSTGRFTPELPSAS